MEEVGKEVYNRTLKQKVKMNDKDKKKGFLSNLMFAEETALLVKSVEQLPCLV